jgi:hypothetical protein
MPDGLVEANGTIINGMWAVPDQPTDVHDEEEHSRGNRCPIKIQI